jgi:hypothetical protein
MYAKLRGQSNLAQASVGGELRNRAALQPLAIPNVSLGRSVRRKVPPGGSLMAAIGAQIGGNSRQEGHPTLRRRTTRPTNAQPSGPSMFASLAGHSNFAKSPKGRKFQAQAPHQPPAIPKPSGGRSSKRVSDVLAAIGAQSGRNSIARGQTNPHKRRRPTQACQTDRSLNSGPTTPPRTLDGAAGKKPAIGGQTVAQWLQELREEELRSATWKKGLLFVDLFSGKCSPVGRGVGKRGGAYIAFDVLVDERFDLNNPEVEQVLRGWIQQGLVWGVWLGTDCTTWSRASYSKGPGWFNSYRSRQNLWGELAQLSPKAKRKVLEGNAHALFSIRILQHVANQPLAVAGLENPAGSVIWLLPELLALGRGHPSKIHHSTCHYCQYGTRWKKPATFLWVGTAQAQAPCKTCKTKKGHICARTGREHLRLGQGRRHPSSGKELTKLATQYSAKLAAQLVDCLASGPV